jgi:hypothetical protein
MGQVEIPLEPNRIQGALSGPLRYLTQPNNVGTIVTGSTTPPKIMSCGIVTDSQDRFLAHIHGTYQDYLHFLELRGVGVDGGCPLCEAEVPLIEPQTFYVSGGKPQFIEATNLNTHLIQMHPE